ncbi:hypothetical protein [Pseudogemmobacter bohemicus]|uniref:hypothetical protein n=1 Tax=Pseudogemmobacter bohemicus TaxID=2250708 RepID=UPI0013009AE5|nr:hypothetical protein [Pseudogemmobacter bohemicus]
MADNTFGNPQTHRAAPGEPCAALQADQALRRQCLVWAFQTRELRDLPHMHVINVAQSYYDFICNQSEPRGAMAEL